MSNSTARGQNFVSPAARHIAERAATRAGVTLEEWLDQAIVGHAVDPEAGASDSDAAAIESEQERAACAATSARASNRGS